jgi:hypothetical protein
MRRKATTLLKRLPNSWVFGAFWMVALFTMAIGAVRAA